MMITPGDLAMDHRAFIQQTKELALIGVGVTPSSVTVSY